MNQLQQPAQACSQKRKNRQKTVVLGFRCVKEKIDRVDLLSKRLGLTRSEFMVTLLDETLGKYESITSNTETN